MQIKQFCICTISNDLSMYEAMKASFLRAGFDEEHCQYLLFDNSLFNLYDPYSVINTVMSEAIEPYIIFCHQDVLLNEGHGYDQLRMVLEALQQLDPSWAVAGNAGGSDEMSLVLEITDPSGQWHDSDLPKRVHSLDENFLVIKSTAGIGCSPELSGFHLYGLDLCLNAIRKFHSCYVVDFHLNHLSPGNAYSDSFRVCLKRFQQHWNPRFTCCLIKTTCTFFCLSRFRIVRSILRRQSVSGWIVSHINVYRFFGRCAFLLRRHFAEQSESKRHLRIAPE